MELGLKVAGLLTGGGPGALDEAGLEPGCALAHAIGSPLAGALVVPGTQTGPGDEMAIGGEAAHIRADLGHDGAGAEVADPGIVVKMVIAARKGSTLASTS